MRTDCQGRSRGTNYEAIAGMQVSEGGGSGKGGKEADSGYISMAQSTGFAKTGGGV